MAYISAKLRQHVIERALQRCEYCQTQQIIVVSMEIDHIIPESVGGKTHLENLCLACISCNGFKLNFQTAIDPDTQEEISLFNPRTQHWHTHFRWSDDSLRVVGLTAAGRATIVRLRMNRDAIVSSRKRWVEAGWHPPSVDSS